MTDTELKQLLAKMLPEQVTAYSLCLAWEHSDVEILDTELLHLCRVAEMELGDDETVEYVLNLFTIVLGYVTSCPLSLGETIKLVSATWQQRILALAKVKGLL